jgi:Skp family chaperone for outer membrane proteins
MNRINVMGLAGVLIAAGVLGAALPGVAQKNAKAKDSTVGFVDLGRVTDQIKKTPTWQVMTKRFEDERTKFQAEIADLTKIRYLSDVERKEFETLKAKAKPTDSEKARTAELEARSDALDKEFTTLAGQEKPTPEQEARLKALAKMRETAVNALQEETDKRSQSLRDLEGQVLEEMQGKILKFVEQVADSKNLVMVIDRQAVLYGGLDLTEDVLKKLGSAPK